MRDLIKKIILGIIIILFSALWMVNAVLPSSAKVEENSPVKTIIDYPSGGSSSLTNLNSESHIWLVDGDFEKPTFDTGIIEDECTDDAPWGDNSWGIEAASFQDASGEPPPGRTIELA